MDENHILHLHVYKTIRCLQGVLVPDELNKIRAAVRVNVRKLMLLGQSHLRFAAQATGRESWRQRVSRSYYCCYSVSRAVRLATEGYYTAEVGDHKRVGELPKDFPSRELWEDLLTKFRADRNLSDYDHTVSEAALELPSLRYLKRARHFVRVSRRYLKGKALL